MSWTRWFWSDGRTKVKALDISHCFKDALRLCFQYPVITACLAFVLTSGWWISFELEDLLYPYISGLFSHLGPDDLTEYPRMNWAYYFDALLLQIAVSLFDNIYLLFIYAGGAALVLSHEGGSRVRLSYVLRIAFLFLVPIYLIELLIHVISLTLMLAFIVPALLFTLSTYLAIFSKVDQNISIPAALRYSRDITNNNRMRLFVLIIFGQLLVLGMTWIRDWLVEVLPLLPDAVYFLIDMLPAIVEILVAVTMVFAYLQLKEAVFGSGASRKADIFT